MSSNIIGQTLLNQFRVESFIASGGMGAVYKVWDLQRNVHLAMKVLHGDLAEDPSMFKRFQREARALQKLSHPHIVPFYGLKQTPDFFFLLEKYIDGPTLKDILKSKRGPLALQEALDFFNPICAALGFAHHNGVVHCDIKPGNVMVDRGGNIYLTDFGIARHAESTATTFGGAGTPAYMAPEQITDRAVTPATDVYALGILLFEMLTGVRPFRGDEPGSRGDTSGERIRYAHLNLNAPDPRILNRTIPVELAAVITKALAKSSADRYANATEMLDAVKRAVGMKDSGSVPSDDEDVTEYTPVPPSPESGNFLRNLIAGFNQYWPDLSSNRAVRISSVVILLVILSTFAIGRIGRSRVTDERPTEAAPIVGAPARTATPVRTRTPVRNTPSEPTHTPVPAVVSGRNSHWIVYTYGTDQDSTGTDPRQLEMINIQTGETKRLSTGKGGINFPSFSPRGDKIVYTGCSSDLCQLYILEIDSGKIEKLTGINMKAMWPSWCSDGDKDLIAFEGRVTSSNRAIFVYDSSTQKVTQLSNGSYDLRPSWSPDCSKVVFLREINGHEDIYVHDVKADRDYAVVESEFDEFNASFSPDGRKIIFTRVTQDTNGDTHLTLNDNSDLLVMNEDGSNITALTNNRYGVFSPSYSPDGKQIVFIAFTGSSQRQEIIVYSFDDDSFETVASNGPYNHTDWSP